MKVLLSARVLLGICVVLLCINLCVMLPRSQQAAYAEEKKADAAFTYQIVANPGDFDKFVDKLNKAGEQGWRAKGIAMSQGSEVVLMEKAK
jgi:hypothetical protein